jgi:hypothetical protein
MAPFAAGATQGLLACVNFRIVSGPLLHFVYSPATLPKGLSWPARKQLVPDVG